MAKTEKICIVCGNNFKGTAKAECCGSNCRVKLKRLLEKGEQPKFRLIGGKNTIPQKPEINVQDLTKQTNEVIPITEPKKNTNTTIKTTGINQPSNIQNKISVKDILKGMGHDIATSPKPYKPYK